MAPDDERVSISLNKTLPYDVLPNETLIATITFTPDISVTAVNTNFEMIFECDKINIDIIGKISAPGLLADPLDFGKVRLFESKTLDGKILNAGNIQVKVEGVSLSPNEPVFVGEYSRNFPATLMIDESINYNFEFTPTELRTYQSIASASNDNALSCSFSITGIGAAPYIVNIVLD